MSIRVIAVIRHYIYILQYNNNTIIAETGGGDYLTSGTSRRCLAYTPQHLIINVFNT